MSKRKFKLRRSGERGTAARNPPSSSVDEKRRRKRAKAVEVQVEVEEDSDMAKMIHDGRRQSADQQMFRASRSSSALVNDFLASAMFCLCRVSSSLRAFHELAADL